MTTELQAFLYALDSTGDWVPYTFTQLEPLMDAAQAALQGEGCGALIHVGFWQPPIDALADLAVPCTGALIVSDSAAGALGDHLMVSAAAVACIQGVVFRRAVLGQGLHSVIATPDHAATEPVRAAPRPAPAPALQEPAAIAGSTLADWLDDLATTQPALALQAAAAGVVDDETYLADEATLPRQLRLALGLARFAALAGAKPAVDNILETLSASPPWFLGLRLDNLGLSTRQANVFRAHNLQRVADLSALGQVGLLMLPNMGYGSVHNLRTQLLDGLESGVGLPPDTDAGTAGQAAGGHTGQVAHNLVAGFKDAAVLLNDAERNVWAGRLGFGCTPMTMQELADAMGLTRERVRQIENQVYRKVERHPFWQELATHLDAALHGRRNALWMTDLPAIDAWFAEAPALATALAGALKRLLSDRFGAIQIEDAWVVSHLRPQEWNEACQSARLMLEAGAKDRIGEGVARWQCDQLLTGRGEELRPILWAQATANALWSARAGQSRRLVSMDSGTESVVIAVLESSDEPLHFTDIHSRACELRASGYDLGSIQNAAHAVAVLFGRGTYGLPDHIPLTSDELVLVRAEVEDLMAGADSGRQWHASEICEALQERGLSFDGKLTKYIVNHALKGNGALVYLRRMVWALGAQWQEGASSRLEVRQAVIDLLEAQGRPMTTPEIRARLAAARGVNQTFQIYPAAPLVRIGTGLWGLLHRDVNVDGAKAVLTRLHEALQARQTGLHLTEIPQVLGLQGDELAAKSAWLPVADGLGISVDRGQYAYITAWGTSRRLAAHEAVEAAVVGVGAEGVDFETICSRVNVLAQRQVPTTHVSVALPDVGMVYDAACRRWKPEASATGS